MKRLLPYIAAVSLILSPFALASAATILFPNGGGTGNGTKPTYGQVLVGNSGGTYTPTATSSLGISGGGGSTASTTLLSDNNTFSGATTLANATFTINPKFPGNGAGNASFTTQGRLYSSATSTATIGSGLSYTGTWGSFIDGLSGTLSVAGLTTGNFSSPNISQWTNNSGYLTSLAGAASSTILGDKNTWSGLNTFSIAPTLATLNGLIAGNNGATYAISTSTAVNFSITGNAGTATALAANGTNCSAGNYPLGVDASGNAESCTAAGTGTLTAVSIASANGFAGSSSGGSTPALTLTTSITGLLKGNGTAISAAALADFPAIAANTVLANNTSGSAAPTAVATSSLFQNASATNSGLLTSTDWNTFNGKGNGTVTSVTGTYPVQSTGGTTPALSLAFGTTTTNIWSNLNTFSGGASTTALSANTFNVGQTGTTTITSAGFVGIASSTPYSSLSVGSGNASSTITVAEYAYGKTGNEATSTAKVLTPQTSSNIYWPIGTAATTLTLCKFTPGQHMKVHVQNPNGTAGALTWNACAGYQLYWPSKTTPTQTTTANDWDIWSFDASDNVGSTTQSFLISGAQSSGF